MADLKYNWAAYKEEFWIPDTILQKISYKLTHPRQLILNQTSFHLYPQCWNICNACKHFSLVGTDHNKCMFQG